MKTSTQVKPVAEPQAPIVPVGEMAPVQASGIQNKNNVATDANVATYCAQIRAGKPTGKIFPNKVSEMEFTDGQREAIRLARKAHKENCIAAKKDLLKVIQAKDVRTIAHRTNHDGSKGRVGYVKESAFVDKKTGTFSEKRFAAFVEGPKPKTA